MLKKCNAAPVKPQSSPAKPQSSPAKPQSSPVKGRFLYYSNLLEPRYKGMILTPYPEYQLSARVMNNYHLALMIKLVRQAYAGLIYPKGYSNAPIIALWKDTPAQLLQYGIFLTKEASNRKLYDRADDDYNFFKNEYMFRGADGAPFWLGNLHWHRYHRSLMHKNDEVFYSAMFIKTGVGINFESEYTANPDAIFKQEPKDYERERLVAHAVNMKTVP